MNKRALYKMALKAIKAELDLKTDEKRCRTCLVQGIRAGLNAAQLYDYEEYDGSPCGRVLFYLQDLGIIKILKGVPLRGGGVICSELRVKILPSESNKI